MSWLSPGGKEVGPELNAQEVGKTTDRGSLPTISVTIVELWVTFRDNITSPRPHSQGVGAEEDPTPDTPPDAADTASNMALLEPPPSLEIEECTTCTLTLTSSTHNSTNLGIRRSQPKK